MPIYKDWYLDYTNKIIVHTSSELPYVSQTGNFTVGDIVTGGTSLATARIVADTDDGITGILHITYVTGTFQNNETITDETTGSATSNIPSGLTVKTTVYTVRNLYTFLQDQLDATATVDDDIPMSSQTPSEFTLLNGWFLDDTSTQFLSGGAIQTSGWDGEIQILTFDSAGYGSPTNADIGKTVGYIGGSPATTGILLGFDNTLRKWWVRGATTFSDLTTNIDLNDAGDYGDLSTASTTGETIWSNIYTLGSLVTGTTMDLYQNDTQITPWWLTGHIDVLVKVKEASVEIDSGNLTILARLYSTLYDHYVIDASSGRNPVPLAAFADGNNETAEGTVAGYTGITFDFGATSQDLDNGNGPQPYDVIIDCGTNTLAKVYEYLKYVTRSGSAITFTGYGTIPGEYYQGVGDIRFDYDNEGGGGTAFSEGELITGTGGGAPTGYLVSLIDVGATGTMVLRNVHGTFTNNQTITGGTTGRTALVNGTVTTIDKVKQAPFGTFAGGTFFGARGVWITNYDLSDSNNFELIDSDGDTQSPPLVVVLTVNGVKSAEEQLTHGAITGGDNAFSVGNYLRGVTSSAVGTIRQAVDGTHTVVGEITGTFSSTEVVNETTTGLAGDDTGDSATVSAKTTKYVRCRIEAKIGGDLPVGTQIMNEQAETSYGSEGYYKATEVFTYTNDQPVLVRARYRGYVPFETSAVISSSDLTVTAIWMTDTNYREK